MAAMNEDETQIQPIVPEKTMATGKPPHIKPNLKPMRTYEGDVAEVLSNKNISTASIALAEKRRATGEDRIGSASTGTPAYAGGQNAVESGDGDPAATRKKTIIIAASIALVCVGLIGAYLLYSISPLAPTKRVLQPQTAPSVIASDAQVAIPIDGMIPTTIIAAVRAEASKPQSPNTIKEIVLVQTKGDQRFRIAGSDMAAIMNTGAPDILTRALANDWMIGVYADANGANDVFVVATVDYFQNAFAGMLQWEGIMADDLKQYFYRNSPTDIASVAPVMASTTASTTSMDAISTPDEASTSSTSTSSALAEIPPVNQPYITVLRGNFIDRIVQNKDVREFVTTDGKILFLYSFIDDTKLVMTDSEATLSEILRRLERQTFVR
jgi:hypothetical protein